jgi:hypothetical protein
MEVQVFGDLWIAKTGTEKQGWSVNGAAGYDDGFAADGNVMAFFCEGYHTGCLAGFDAKFLRACFGDDARAIFLRVSEPRFRYRLFGAEAAAKSAEAAEFSLIAS